MYTFQYFVDRLDSILCENKSCKFQLSQTKLEHFQIEYKSAQCTKYQVLKYVNEDLFHLILPQVYIILASLAISKVHGDIITYMTALITRCQVSLWLHQLHTVSPLSLESCDMSVLLMHWYAVVALSHI